HGPGPGTLGVCDRGAGRVVRVAVVVALDLEAAVVALALDADLVPRVHLVAVAGALDHGVAHPPGFGHQAVAPGGDQHPADLVGIALRGVRADLLIGRPGDPYVRELYSPVE